MLPQSKVDGYMGKHGATVPSVRMMTLFCPARQFHSEKCSPPSSPCLTPGVVANISATFPFEPVPSPYQPYFLRSRPDDIRMKAFISCSRCTEFTIWYPAL